MIDSPDVTLPYNGSTTKTQFMNSINLLPDKYCTLEDLATVSSNTKEIYDNLLLHLTKVLDYANTLSAGNDAEKVIIQDICANFVLLNFECISSEAEAARIRLLDVIHPRINPLYEKMKAMRKELEDVDSIIKTGSHRDITKKLVDLYKFYNNANNSVNTGYLREEFIEYVVRLYAKLQESVNLVKSCKDVDSLPQDLKKVKKLFDLAYGLKKHASFLIFLLYPLFLTVPLTNQSCLLLKPTFLVLIRSLIFLMLIHKIEINIIYCLRN